jgi:predicted RNA-binding protein Jag
MSLSAREYLHHILDETTYIMTSSTGLDRARFVNIVFLIWYAER